MPARAAWYATRLSERMPQLADRVRPLVTLAEGGSSDTAPLIGTHGDLHAGQLFIDAVSSRVTGLIDVDTVALGESGTDAGAFLAHAVASAELARFSGDANHATRFTSLARYGSEAWLGPASAEVDSARRHTVGQLLAQAMQVARAHGLDGSAERLIGAAERVVEGRPLVPAE